MSCSEAIRASVTHSRARGNGRGRSILIAAGCVAALAAGAAGAAPVSPATGPTAADTRAAVEREVETIRGLEFLAPVRYRAMDRGRLRRFLEEKIDREIGRRAVGAYQRSLQMLGLLPAEIDLRESYLALMENQITAFFDPDEETLCCVDDLGSGGVLARMILAHELTHVLQHQHYDLDRLSLDPRDDDDRVMAAMALAEGDATRVMNEMAARHATPSALQGAAAESMSSRAVELYAAPLFLRESLVFPYLEGERFVRAMIERGDETLRATWDDPPEATEQILHPDRYLPGGPAATDVRLPRWARSDSRRAWGTTLGEFGVRCWLETWNGRENAVAAADGWDGDRCDYYEGARNRPIGLAWVTAWDDAAEAAQFAEAAAEAVARRQGRLGCRQGRLGCRQGRLGCRQGRLGRDERPGDPQAFQDRWWAAGTGARVARVWRRDRAVAVVIAGGFADGGELARIASTSMRRINRR